MFCLTSWSSRVYFAEQVLPKSFDMMCCFWDSRWSSCLCRLGFHCLSLLPLKISADTFWHSGCLLSPAGNSLVVTLGRTTRGSSVRADGRAECCLTKNIWLIYESEKPQTNAGWVLVSQFVKNVTFVLGWVYNLHFYFVIIFCKIM